MAPCETALYPLRTHSRERSLALSHWFGLTHWGWVTHICVSKLTIISSDNGLSPGRHQAIIWTNAGILLIGPLRTNFSEISIEIYAVSIKKMHLKMLSWKWRPFCLCLNVLKDCCRILWLCIEFKYKNFSLFDFSSYLCLYELNINLMV